MGICFNFQAPGGRLSYPLKDKSPPCPGRGGVGLCIDRCISHVMFTFVGRFKLEEGDLKYLDEARELIRPERNTLTVSFLDVEEHSSKLATLIQEHYYQ